MKTLVLVFLSLTLVQAHASLVQVSSIYADDAIYPRQLKVRGGGLLFSHGQRFFVFTASHLSQGRDLSIALGTRPLNIVNRAIDPENDLELFEVSGLSRADVHANYNNGQISCQVANFYRRRLVDSYNIVPVDSWVEDPNLEADNAFALTQPQSVRLDLFSYTLHANALIVPGMSGAPLFSTVPTSDQWLSGTAPYDMREGFSREAPQTCLVRGLTLQRDRFFAETVFLPIRQMLPLLQRYLAREKTLSKSHWHASGAILYRVMDGYTAAASIIAGFVGPHISVIGNHSQVIGGDLATIEEDRPREYLQNSASLPVKANPQLHWSLPLAVVISSSALEFSSWFDMNLYAHIKNPSSSKIFSENQPTNFLALLRQRLGRQDNFEILEPAYMRLNNNNVLIRLPLEEGDELRLQLNRYGAFCIDDTCQSRFQPVVEALSHKGKSYIVDVRELFFVEPGAKAISSLTLPESHLMSETQVTDSLREHLVGEMGKPRLSYRRKCPPQPGPMRLEQGIKTTVEWQRSAN